MVRETHPNFAPSDLAGDRKSTAILLVGTAREFNIPQREIASARDGFWISDRLADVLYDESAEDEVSGNPETPAPVVEADAETAPKKTSGNRAAKTGTQNRSKTSA